MRWQADIASVLAQRSTVATIFGLAQENGHRLLWLLPWSGTDSLALSALDPLYIEICRRVRLSVVTSKAQAYATGSKVARIAAKESSGVTGDAWAPIDTAKSKALTVSSNGFDYKLMSELLTGAQYTQGAAWRLNDWPQDAHLQALAQATVRGQGKTEGYHERRVPISPKLRKKIAGDQRPLVAGQAKRRIETIAQMRKLLWTALALLFANGESDSGNDTVSNRASRFAQPFEQQEDARFFDDLNVQIEAESEEQEDAVYLAWLLGLAARAQAVLTNAFHAGPRSAMQRYKAQSAALSRFHAGLRGGKKPLFPELVAHYAAQRESAHPTPFSTPSSQGDASCSTPQNPQLPPQQLSLL